jgi:hypothetical protein
MNTLFAYLKLLPLVLGAVKALEDALPIPGQGKAKLGAILAVVQTAWETEEAVRDDLKGFTVDKLVGIVTKIAGAVVAAFNALGVFRKSPPADPAPTP